MQKYITTCTTYIFYIVCLKNPSRHSQCTCTDATTKFSTLKRTLKKPNTIILYA